MSSSKERFDVMRYSKNTSANSAPFATADEITFEISAFVTWKYVSSNDAPYAYASPAITRPTHRSLAATAANAAELLIKNSRRFIGVRLLSSKEIFSGK